MLSYEGNGASEVISRNAMECMGANPNHRFHRFAMLDL